MHRINRFRPSPALIVASLALLVALGGTGVAAVSKLGPANSVGTNQVVDGSLLAKDIKAGVIPSQGALAYAHVNSDGTIDAALSKNVAAIPARNDEQGYSYYCLDVTTKQAPKNIVVTFAGFTPTIENIMAFMSADDRVASRCQGKADALVATSIEGNFQSQHAFYVVFN